jgi:hypothetical protein
MEKFLYTELIALTPDIELKITSASARPSDEKAPKYDVPTTPMKALTLCVSLTKALPKDAESQAATNTMA